MSTWHTSDVGFGIYQTNKQVLTIDQIKYIFQAMDTVSISQLKTNPSKVISWADDYPLVVKNRGVTKAYIIGRELFEKLVSCVENFIDKKAVQETDFKKGKGFEQVAKELNL